MWRAIRNVGYVLAVAAVWGGIYLYTDAEERKAENAARQELLLARAHICVNEAKARGNASERGVDLKLDSWDQHEVNGRPIVSVATRFVSVRAPDPTLAPIISAQCEFAGPKSERLVTVHAIQSNR